MSKPWAVFEGKHFTVYHEEVEVEPGQWDLFEYVARTDGTRIIALDMNQVLLTHEYRHELGKHDWRLPGGRVEAHEDLIAAAQRELREETGYVSGSWEFLWSTTPDSTVRYRRHFFMARDHERGAHQRDLGERITVDWVDLEEAYRLALAGEISEEISALALLRVRHLGKARSG